MLTAPAASRPENLLIDTEDPFRKPQIGGEDGVLDDVNTGSVHVEAHELLCTGENDVLAEIICFIDKSYIDQKGKCTLEPVMFTLGIFSRKYRNRPEAWRPMGYIPNIDHLAPRANAVDKLHDYHYCLRIIMSEMIEYQKLQGIDWRMLMGNEWKDMRLKIPLSYIIGDTEGHDKTTSWLVERSIETP
jgi:hypothetical protein